MEKYGLTSVTDTGRKGGELWGTMTGDEKQVIRCSRGGKYCFFAIKSLSNRFVLDLFII